MKETLLFDDDQKKIEEAVLYHAMGSYQIGEIAYLSALLYDRGINVIKELEKLSHASDISVTEIRERGRRRGLYLFDE